MTDSPDIRFDVSSVLNRGRRDHQEDAIATDFPLGAEFGYAVLSDGMGGHAAGDVASKIVVTEVFSELKFQSTDTDGFADNVCEILTNAAISANACMAAHTAANPDTAGMGATLVAPVFINDSLFWISIGDSPLYLYRDNRLAQLNEDHSLGPHIDYMVRSGMMAEDVGRNHPDRNALTSVLIGEAIERIDCPKRPFRVRDGDVLVVASDGLQFLTDTQIKTTLDENTDADAAGIAEALLNMLKSLNDPEQDNISFSVIRIQEVEQAVQQDPNVFTPDFASRTPRSVTTRPIKPVELPESPDFVAARSKADGDDRGKDAAPIFLRRRWVAQDGPA